MTAAKPTVSVCVVTYNQEKFIGPCLDSLLDQDCRFPYEIIVGDDASTDGTTAIVRDYAQRHPDKIRAILHPKNLGPTRNYFAVHGAAKADLIAHMDGDDLAYPPKLRRQVELLEAHPECSMCVHDVDNLVGDAISSGSYFPDLPLYSDLDYLCTETAYFVQSSKMYRRSAMVSTTWPGHELVDLYGNVEHAAHGPIIGTRERLGAYRVQVGMSMSTLAHADAIYQGKLEALDRALALGASPRAVRRGRAQAQYIAAVKFLKLGDRERFQREVRLSPRDYLHARRGHVVMSLFRKSRAMQDWFLRRWKRPYAPKSP